MDVLVGAGGFPPAILNGEHHPCPRCGGTDRFRMIDDKAGAVLCGQCFAERNGDGFSAVAWMLGVKFPDAVSKVAAYLGVKATKEDDPAKDLRFEEWSSQTAAIFCNAKKPITEEALLRAGARMAMYKERHSVIAFPVIGSDLDCSKPVGWLVYNYNAAPLPKWNRKGEIIGQVKVKLLFGSKPGLVGVHGIERLKTPGMVEIAWKTEGPTDLLALLSAIPESMADRHVAVTNANGASETPRWSATLLAGHRCCIVHDSDKPGQAGAEKWARSIASQAPPGMEPRNIVLPYDVEETHGKDLRDYFESGRTYPDLLAIADSAAPVVVARTADGDIDYTKANYPIQDRILKKLQIEILYEEENGSIRLFSTLLRKSSTIRSIDRLKQDVLIQICGPPAIEHVVRSEADTSDDQWTMDDIRQAIALAASNRRGKNNERGVGIWQGLDEWGDETETIVLVGNSEGARWNGDKVLRRILAPRADGLVLDFGSSSTEWYDFETTTRHLELAKDLAWRQGVITEAVDLFGRWRWKHQDTDPTLLTGLVLSTFIQTIWAWRPLVAINGESNSGKSFLFEALGGAASHRGLFGGLAFKQAKSTEAGIRQGIGKTACIILCDEFEHSNERKKILENLLRPATRGESIARGTAGEQKGVQYRLQHIGWVAAIETGLKDQPDANRFISFELLTASKGSHGKLRLPDGRQLADLGQRLMAVAVTCGIEAKKLAQAIKDTPVEGIDSRAIESYSVPASMLAIAEGHGDEVARGLLVKLTESIDRADHGHTDQEELLSDIITSSIHLDSKNGVRAVGQVLQSESMRAEYSDRLESVGIRYTQDYDLFVAPKLVSAHLLRSTAWEGKRIDQILLRLTGAHRSVQRICGKAVRGIIIPDATSQIGYQPSDAIDAEAVGF